MKKIGLLLILCLFGCRKESPDDQKLIADNLQASTALDTLRKYPSGNQLLNKIDYLKSSTGLVVNIHFKDMGDVNAMVLNGDYEGSIEQINGGYNVYIRRNLPASLTAHAIAHELQHVADDYEVDQVLRYHPNIDTLSRTTLNGLAAGQIQQMNRSAVDYVLVSIFCSETRSYDTNRRLIREGLQDERMNMITSHMPEHIDAAYIQKYGTNYGANAPTLVNWCLGHNSMTEIKNVLIRNIN